MSSKKTRSKTAKENTVVDLTEMDTLSECSQDHDLKTAQKEISELKELLKCLRSCKQSKPVQVQIWNTERQIERIKKAHARCHEVQVGGRPDRELDKACARGHSQLRSS